MTLNRRHFGTNGQSLNGKHEGHRDGSEKTGRSQAHSPRRYISWASTLFLSLYTWEQWRGNTEASEKENTLKASMGVKEQRWPVMAIRVDRRSNTGGSLLWILPSRNDSPTHWVPYPVSHGRTQPDPQTYRSLYTRLANFHAARHVHAMQMCCLTCKHTTAFMQLEEKRVGCASGWLNCTRVFVTLCSTFCINRIRKAILG